MYLLLDDVDSDAVGAVVAVAGYGSTGEGLTFCEVFLDVLDFLVELVDG